MLDGKCHVLMSYSVNKIRYYHDSRRRTKRVESVHCYLDPFGFGYLEKNWGGGYVQNCWLGILFVLISHLVFHL